MSLVDTSMGDIYIRKKRVCKFESITVSLGIFHHSPYVFLAFRESTLIGSGA